MRRRVSDREPRVNDRIGAKQVRLVGPDGAQIGIKSIGEARKLASDLGLDLVEVAADARPPVVRMMDYHSFVDLRSDRDPDAPSIIVRTPRGLLRSVWPLRRWSLRLIGYWRMHADLPDRPGTSRVGTSGICEIAAAYAKEVARWPDARKFVDPTWPPEIRHSVAVYVAGGAFLRRYRGLSPCRFCGRHNGSAEFTDGSYYWPEGLAHYITEHDVRLPDEFVVPALASLGSCKDLTVPEFDDRGQRVSSRHLEIATLNHKDQRTVWIDQRWWRKQQQL